MRRFYSSWRRGLLVFLLALALALTKSGLPAWAGYDGEDVLGNEEEIYVDPERDPEDKFDDDTQDDVHDNAQDDTHDDDPEDAHVNTHDDDSEDAHVNTHDDDPEDAHVNTHDEAHDDAPEADTVDSGRTSPAAFAETRQYGEFYLLGDVNRAGAVTVDSLIRLARHLAEFEDDKLYGRELLLADANQDGAVTIADLVLLARHVADPERLPLGSVLL